MTKVPIRTSAMAQGPGENNLQMHVWEVLDLKHCWSIWQTVYKVALVCTTG